MFQPGQPGNPRGRPKGSPNKRSLATIRRLEALGVDPIAEMVKIATDPSVDIKTRASMFRELAQYSAPKRKAVAAGTSVPLGAAPSPPRQGAARVGLGAGVHEEASTTPLPASGDHGDDRHQPQPQ